MCPLDRLATPVHLHRQQLHRMLHPPRPRTNKDLLKKRPKRPISGGALVLLAIGAALFFMIKDKKEDLEHDSDVEDRHFHSNNHGARNINGNFRQQPYQQPKASPVVQAYASSAVSVSVHKFSVSCFRWCICYLTLM